MIPVTAEAMRGLKAKKDEDVRRFQVQSLVKHIYSQAVYKATTTTETSYMHHCGMYQTFYSSELYSKSKEEVLLALRDLFPGCRVSTKKFVQRCSLTLGPAELVEVDNFRIFADKSAEDYFIVDWS